MPAIELKIELERANSADARVCIEAYFGELQQLLEEGFDPSNSVSASPDELTPPSGYFLIARHEGKPVGCVALKVNAKAGEIKRMWVSPEIRGAGAGQQLLAAVETLAREIGLQALRLDTNRHLVAARALYSRNGYEEIAAYNDNPYAHHWFEKRL